MPGHKQTTPNKTKIINLIGPYTRSHMWWKQKHQHIPKITLLKENNWEQFQSINIVWEFQGVQNHNEGGYCHQVGSKRKYPSNTNPNYFQRPSVYERQYCTPCCGCWGQWSPAQESFCAGCSEVRFVSIVCICCCCLWLLLLLLLLLLLWGWTL